MNRSHCSLCSTRNGTIPFYKPLRHRRRSKFDELNVGWNKCSGSTKLPRVEPLHLFHPTSYFPKMRTRLPQIQINPRFPDRLKAGRMINVQISVHKIPIASILPMLAMPT